MKAGPVRLQTVLLIYCLPALTLISLVCAILNYRSLYKTILDGFDRKLYAISTTSAAFIDGDQHSTISSEESPAYQNYVKPLQRILRTTGLTYHYTLRPLSENRIMYIIDATEGEDHSDSGTIEENPPEEAQRLQRVVENGRPSLSDIQKFDIWGQLKIGSAPIINSKDKVEGLVGADVNISTINAKTSQAMLYVFSIGALTLLLASWFSIYIAGKFTRPIETIKQSALQVAAGNYGTCAEVTSPAELRQLAGTLNSTSHKLQQNNLENSRLTKERAALINEIALRQAFATAIKAGKQMINDSVLTIGENQSILFAGKQKSRLGVMQSGEMTIIWMLAGQEDPTAEMKMHSDLKTIIERLPDAAAANMQKALSSLIYEKISYFLLIDRVSGNLSLINGASGVYTQPLPGNYALQLKPDENPLNWLTLTNGDLSATI